MNTGLYRIEWSRFAGSGGRLPGRPGTVIDYFSINYFMPGLILLAVVLMAGYGVWMALSNGGSDVAKSEPLRLAAAEPETVSPPATAAAQQGALQNAAPAEAAPAADGLKISSQHWRRGGLGSNALVTFTLRNGNDYAVRDIEISCAFSRGDGSHLTDRTRVIHDTVRRKGRKTFARLHIGFINVNAEYARCEPVTASRI
jgi:hypothetical protein